jgi:hypothetical protein
MSTSNLRFPQDLGLILHFVRNFITGNMRHTLAEAGVQVLQPIYDSASRELEKCVPFSFFFALLTLL